MTIKPKPCPICRKPRTQDHFPFCSQRCRDRDLAQWFGDGYAVPGEPVNPEDMPSLGEEGQARDGQE